MRTLLLLLMCLVALTSQLDCGQTPIPPDLRDMSSEIRVKRIVGGRTAIPYSWPWQVLLCAETCDGRSTCGASVLSAGWLVTAAHCVDKYSTSSLIVQAGKFNRLRPNEPGSQIRLVSRLHIHPNFTNTSRKFDIALIKLATPLIFTDHIQPVCLSSKNAKVNPARATTGWISGWGRTQEHGKKSDGLKQTNVPFVPKDKCAQAYPIDFDSVTMFCAGSRGNDQCDGDSGGPLVRPTGSTWFQYGISSFGNGCGREGFPGVYTRISTVCDWIFQITGGRIRCVDPY